MNSTKRWLLHWCNVDTSASFTQAEALRQVGKTVLGEPVGVEQIEILVENIVTKLELSFADRVIDCGCGNGLVTSRVGIKVQNILGIDFSQSLLDVAQANYSVENIRYVKDDLTDLASSSIQSNYYNKAFSCEVLQHLEFDSAYLFLNKLTRLLKPGFKIFICGVPDRSKLHKFYNTPERWKLYCRNAQRNLDQIGYWWGKEELIRLATLTNLKATFFSQPNVLYTAHYRFDILLEAR